VHTNAFTSPSIRCGRTAESLIDFVHADHAVYVFGPEDGSVGRAVLGLCHRLVITPTRHCTNLAAAVYTVLYDRHAKRVAAGLEQVNTVTGRGFDEPDHTADAVGVT
jgi:tRNA C32,U32 (ribose-2'-O)-methylase TrmJ